MDGLHIERLTAGVRGTNYLTNVSLSVELGEAVALVGKGGDRRLLMRIVRECARGKIGFVENNDIIARIKCGSDALVIECDNLFEYMTVRQYLMYNAGATTLTKIEKLDRIFEALNTVGLPELEETLISRLTRTQKALLNIAAGLFFRPEVLLLCLDDLVYSQDAEQMLGRAIAAIKGKGIAVLASVNDSRLLSEFDRIILMREGKVIEHGTVEDIVAKYSYCVYSVKTDSVNIKRLAKKFSELRSIFKVQPRGGTLYLYSLDKQSTGREMLKAIGEDANIEELRMVSPSIKDALTRAEKAGRRTL